MSDKLTGTVKWFSPDKGFGFITRENEKDLFVHFTGLLMEGYKTLNEGDVVTYNIGQGQRGDQAIDVEVVSSSKAVETTPES